MLGIAMLSRVRVGGFIGAVLGLGLISPGPVWSAPLSALDTPAVVDSPRGSGIFGVWTTDRFGLPAYRYEIDQARDPRAIKPQDRKSSATHQVGNHNLNAFAFNDGATQVFSMRRHTQWFNLREPRNNQHGGGFGWLAVAGESPIATQWNLRPQGAQQRRTFGVGYARREMSVRDVSIDEVTYAPYGNDPVILRDVTIRNNRTTALKSTWWEYWGVNPVSQTRLRPRHSVGRTRWEPQRRLLVFPQQGPGPSPFAIFFGIPSPYVTPPPPGAPTRALPVFAAQLAGPNGGFEASTSGFFGAGGMALPDAVARDRARGSLAPPTLGNLTPSRALAAFRSPVSVAPGQEVTLRYVYGSGTPAEIDSVISRHKDGEPWAQSSARWKAEMPQVDLGEGQAHLAREAQWSQYQTHSATMLNESCGGHVITQGDYYQYVEGAQIAWRDPLQHALPLIYTQPWIARATLRSWAGSQRARDGATPYGTMQLCQKLDYGASTDLALWAMYVTAEYVNATRDTSILSEMMPFADGSQGTLWEHLERSFSHLEDVVGIGPGGLYRSGRNGDWNDSMGPALGLRESTYVMAQAAAVYPILASLAERHGRAAFAGRLRTAATRAGGILQEHWVPRGWYDRGWTGGRWLGREIIYNEQQPWALLTPSTSTERARVVTKNIRRYLTGEGSRFGRARIGSAGTPSVRDEGVSKADLPRGVRNIIGNVVGTNGSGLFGGRSAGWAGGVWYAHNGMLVLSMTERDDIPGGRAFAIDEWKRNTLANHAEEFPEHWNAITSAPDACWEQDSRDPGRCGIAGLSRDWPFGHNTMQPSWMLFDLVRLAGLQPKAGGYRIDPSFEGDFSVRLAAAGVRRVGRTLDGYVRPLADGPVDFEVRVPSTGVTGVKVNGVAVPYTVEGDWVRFAAAGRANTAVDWEVL